MTFKELVQSKLPSHLLGARVVGVEYLVNCEALKAHIEGSNEMVLVSGLEMLQNGIDLSNLGVPRIATPAPAPYNPREWR